MKIIPLTVLAYEGPMVRGYLAKLHEAGFRPAHIVLLVLDHHPATKRPLPHWLPKKLRLVLGEHMQQTSLMYWPQKLLPHYPWLAHCLKEGLAPHYGDTSSFLQALTNPVPFEKYSDSVEKVLISNFKDAALIQALSQLADKTVLFTGGGIMPRQLFEIPEIHYLHIHPGHLPEIRGADGLLWSLLVRSKPGASCFYMNPGLDMGDLIFAHDVPKPVFHLPSNIVRPDDQTLYRILFSYCDPLLRATVLMRFIQKMPDFTLSSFASLPAYKQNENEGVTYHFMHPLLRKVALEKLFII